jgi:hypothetical protein
MTPARLPRAREARSKVAKKINRPAAGLVEVLR